jgi:hypothetical protein
MTPIIPNLKNWTALKPLSEEVQTSSGTQAFSSSEATLNDVGLVSPVEQSDLSAPHFYVPSAITKEDWTPEVRNRFLELVKRKSLGMATDEEKKQLASLQAIRRAAEENITPEQVLFELRRERAIQEITAVFERHSVTVGSFPPIPTSKG